MKWQIDNGWHIALICMGQIYSGKCEKVRERKKKQFKKFDHSNTR